MTIRPRPVPTHPSQGTRKGYPYHIRSVHLTMNAIAQSLSPELIEAVAVVAARRSKPLDNADLTINYRKQVTPVFVRCALNQLAES